MPGKLARVNPRRLNESLSVLTLTVWPRDFENFSLANANEIAERGQARRFRLSEHGRHARSTKSDLRIMPVPTDSRHAADLASHSWHKLRKRIGISAPASRARSAQRTPTQRPIFSLELGLIPLPSRSPRPDSSRCHSSEPAP